MLISDLAYKQAIGIIRCGTQHGTVFLIDPERAVTAFHVLTYREEHPIEIEFRNIEEGNRFSRYAELIDKDPDHDIALLKLTEPVEDNRVTYLSFAAAQIQSNVPLRWNSYGYPEDKQDDGSNLSGKVNDSGKMNNPQKYDLDLFCDQYKGGFDIKGVSGAPVIIGGEVKGVIRKRLEGETLGAVSVEKFKRLLENNGIDYLPKPKFQKEELRFLEQMKKLRVGYGKEDLPYQETFASWKCISEYGEQEDTDQEVTIEEVQEREAVLSPIQDLINEYFPTDYSNDTKRILFVTADFGKGKSSFLRRAASRLAEEYLENNESGDRLHVRMFMFFSICGN